MGKLHRLGNALDVILQAHRVPAFIETGTFHGESLAYALTLGFSRWCSVELSVELHRRATERFAGYPALTLHNGDSAAVLPEIMASLDTPAMFWLDAHWCFLNTARGPKDCPLLDELEIIADHERRTGLEHVILADDVHIFGTGPDSPCVVTEHAVFVPEADWRSVTVERAQEILGRRKQFHVWGDVLFAVPVWLDLSSVEPPDDPYAVALRSTSLGG
jgi:hypothetical protein